MKAEIKNITPQLLRLLLEADLVDRATLTQYAEKHAKGRSILDIMNQQVSLESFKDLLTHEITFKRGGMDLEKELLAGLSASGMINDDELRQLLATHKPGVERLLMALKSDGAIDGATAGRLIAENSAAPDYSGLILEEGINAEIVCRWLSKAEARQSARSALYVAIQFFNFNGIIKDDELESLMQNLQTQTTEEIAGQLRKRVDLSAAGIKAFLDGDLNVPTADLNGLEIDGDLLDLFPQSLIRRQAFIPILTNADSIVLAMADPFNVTLVALLEWATGRWPQPVFAPAAQISDKIGELYRPKRPAAAQDGNGASPQRGPSAARGADGAQASKPSPSPAPPSRLDTGMVADNISTVQLVSSMIERAIGMRTTDIHIEPARDGLIVRFRIDGDLHRIMAVPRAMSQPVVSRVKVLASMDVTERRRPQDGHFELKIGEHNYDFRISTLPAIQGEKIVIRILDSQRVRASLDSLGMLDSQRESFEWMLARPHGMILVTGPTGSGKSTTLYTGLNMLNSEGRNLVTIEDPVEYQLDGINQVQVDTNIDLNFAEGLRSILRQDPDVIMIGEIRDGATAQIAIRAAMTGHLVLSTLHTNTALGAIDALVHLGAVRFMVAGSLVGIISQRLLRLLCNECKQPIALSAAIRKEFGIPTAGNAKKKIYAAKGCKSCFSTGYFGRMGAFETIKVTDKLRPLIEKHQPDELEAAVRAEGMLTLQEAAVQLALNGATSVDEVRRKIMMEL